MEQRGVEVETEAAGRAVAEEEEAVEVVEVKEVEEVEEVAGVIFTPAILGNGTEITGTTRWKVVPPGELSTVSVPPMPSASCLLTRRPMPEPPDTFQ